MHKYLTTLLINILLHLFLDFNFLLGAFTCLMMMMMMIMKMFLGNA